MRIGLMGYGFGGRYFHAPLLASLPAATFVGVVTRSPERRSELAADHPGVPAFDDLAQLAGAGAEVVVISTGLAGRQALLLQAFELGLGVVSDKPFAQDAAQGQALIDAAQRAGVLLSVYQNRRWDSDFLTLRKLIDSNALGQVRRFESAVERFVPDNQGNPTGGGWLRDLGSHLVDQALQLFGPVARVYAELDRLPAEGLDREFFVALTHANGVISHLRSSALQSAPQPRFRVTGDAACYTVEGFDGQEARALAGRSPATDGDDWGAEEHRNWGWLVRGDERERVPSERGCWPQFYQALATAVAGKGAVPVDPADAVKALRVLDAARRSAELGQVVHLQNE
ncbi:Gfo/Idh/MocA family oxidoreductase [Pseudomonas sp. HR96]|uniref:Gfo/Idh/MocA family protein n=1 Tax=Pseudomonas sp. HR96 TaxID=1027966 RepID=UPI002A760F49|nr:Gfo/Idh/MocA family oxidoreductase [Pseudomonas sp. HR96]WPP01872.1 Gfo/Idh/MocA family oxidoreductase [Pseudomonas sp. HR96]